MSETVRVRITATQQVRYNKIVEMSASEWAQLKRLPERDMELAGVSPLDDYLGEPSDWRDYEDVEADVVGEDGKPVEPADYYNP